MKKGFAIFILLFCLGNVPNGWAFHSSWIEQKAVPGEILVKIKNNFRGDFLQKVQKGKINISIKRDIHLVAGSFLVVGVDEKQSLQSSLTHLKSYPEIELAEPNYYIQLIQPVEMKKADLRELDSLNLAIPNDPYFSKLWGLSNTGSNEPQGRVNGVQGADINALAAWNITKGSDTLKIAVIDTGIDYRHPDLKENLWSNEKELNGKIGFDDDGNGYIDDIYGYDFANNDGDPMDGHGHGTHCAGTIGAKHDNGIGVAGVLDKVKLVGLKFLNDQGSGTTENAIRAIDYATQLDVDIMSNSWGGAGFSQLLKDSIQKASEKGIIFVAAAGNSTTNNDQTPQYPSSYEVENILAVAAHTINDDLASFSSYGKKSVHIAAPGKNIMSTVKGGKYAVYSGTSMATPHVSGVIGLLLAKEGRIPLPELKERIVQTAAPSQTMKQKVLAGGRIDAYNLLTDTRPPRNEPDPTLWKRLQMDEIFESSHPYSGNQKLVKTIQVPGAKFIRLVIKKFDLEKNYDYLTIKDTQGGVIERLTGTGENYETVYSSGDSLIIEFLSDFSIQKWGFRIEALDYIQ